MESYQTRSQMSSEYANNSLPKALKTTTLADDDVNSGGRLDGIGDGVCKYVLSLGPLGSSFVTRMTRLTVIGG